MVTVIIISLITVLATAALALFEPRLHPKHPSVRIYWMAPLAGAAILLLCGGITPAEAAAGLLTPSAVNPIKILILFFSMLVPFIKISRVEFDTLLRGRE